MLWIYLCACSPYQSNNCVLGLACLEYTALLYENLPLLTLVSISPLSILLFDRSEAGHPSNAVLHNG